MAWLKNYPLLSAVFTFLFTAIGVLVLIESLWALYSSDPLIPFLHRILFSKPWLSLRIVLILFSWVIISIGFMLLVSVFKLVSQTANQQYSKKIKADYIKELEKKAAANRKELSERHKFPPS